MGKSATTATIPADKLELYEKLVATNPKVERKGATVPYTLVNGHMFSYLGKSGKLALRLPEEKREAFLKKYKARLCEAYGRVQPEYVEVPDSLLAATRELKPYFDSSFEYVSGLKPKPTKRKREQIFSSNRSWPITESKILRGRTIGSGISGGVSQETEKRILELGDAANTAGDKNYRPGPFDAEGFVSFQCSRYI